MGTDAEIRRIGKHVELDNLRNKNNDQSGPDPRRRGGGMRRRTNKAGDTRRLMPI
jgi:hypothetical protein